MKLFPRGAWGYAVLLVVLFSIAAIATKSVVDFTIERFSLPEYEIAVQQFSLIIWLLTMGLMFLAGALGLLAISATAEYESRHRIVRIVSAMSYISDGLLALDYQGRVKGANPAVRRLVSGQIAIGKKVMLGDIFPSLTVVETRRFLNRQNPCEIEVEFFHHAGLRLLRLRSQPVEGLILAFVSDITELRTANMRQQQMAKLQLLGRIAGGVAHDFSNILSAISGHAVLMQRFGEDKRFLNDSIGVIVNETQRGARLSRQLLALSRSSDINGQPSNNLPENIHEAQELLRVALASAWIVETETKGTFPTVPLSAVQIVQIILNLGLLATDTLKKPGKLLIQLKQPDNVSHDFQRFAAIIMISASTDTEDPGQAVTPSTPLAAVDTTGIIPSVVRAMIEEAGGRLDELYASNAKNLYCISLPYVSKEEYADYSHLKIAAKDALRLKKWNILLAYSDQKLEWLEKILVDMGAVVEKKVTMNSILAAIDTEHKPDVIIADKRLFGAEAEKLLRAIRKICPGSGIIIISRKPEDEPLREEHGFVFLEPDSPEDTWINMIVSSRQLLMPQK